MQKLRVLRAAAGTCFWNHFDALHDVCPSGPQPCSAPPLPFSGGLGRGYLCTDGGWVWSSFMCHFSAPGTAADGGEQDRLQAGTKPSTKAPPAHYRIRALSICAGARRPPQREPGLLIAQDTVHRAAFTERTKQQGHLETFWK